MAPRPALALLAVCAFLASVPPPAQAHGVFEANELEVHVLNDEGSDLIEPYGGYDIQEVFVGFAHDDAFGAGPEGDGFYLRAELYGHRAESAGPAATARWSVAFLLDVGGVQVERTLSTTDGATFETDFDALLVEVEGRDTHVHRAFLAYGSTGAPGQALKVLRVESRVDGDLRDHAPGGIPVPGTDGAAEYPDPTAIEGSGVVTESVELRSPDNYVELGLAAQPGGAYAVTVRSALKEGGQHGQVRVRDDAGWSYALTGDTTEAMDANGTFSFGLAADPANATGPLVLDVLTDVGGRSELRLDLNGTLHGPRGAAVTSVPPPKAKESPGLGAALLLGALAAAAVAVRRRD